jgi:hypothetical protein
MFFYSGVNKIRVNILTEQFLIHTTPQIICYFDFIIGKLHEQKKMLCQNAHL